MKDNAGTDLSVAVCINFVEKLDVKERALGSRKLFNFIFDLLCLGLETVDVIII
jgi:hypothetical protein